MTLALRQRRMFIAALTALLLTARPAAAQPRGAAPPPVEHALTTKDGVQLTITYYASVAGRQAVPVIMLHDYNETRAVFDPLAQRLQYSRGPDDTPAEAARRSRAVVTVDLRGHGESKTALNVDGQPVELDATRFRQLDFQNMVTFDMEAVRSFLVEQNDAGQLNLNKLCLVGSGMGANVAIIWSARDWSIPPLAVRKQGQDVKALALLSPRWNFRGLSVNAALQFPPVQRRLSVLLAYGDDGSDVAEDCENIDEIFSRFHTEPPPGQIQAQKDYYLLKLNTSLQGTELLTSREFGVAPAIAGFIEARLGEKDFPYLPRKK